MIIRPAHVEDAPAMARVIVDTFMVANRGIMTEAALQKRKEEWTYEVSARDWVRAVREIADGVTPRSCVYVAVDEADGVVGFALGCPVKSTEGMPAASGPESNPEINPEISPVINPVIGEVDILYVQTSHQGRGIGRALVQAVAAHLRQMGMTTLHIATLRDSPQARGFYEGLGGHLIGTREHYEDGVIWPLVVYAWSDTQALIAPASSAAQ